MPIYLGIDTGGTFTDAVIFDPDRGVLAAAKSLTTRHDLSIGVAGVLATLERDLAAVPRIDMVSLSTTLATNAIVEGHGSPVCLVLIGQDRDVLSRFGLRDALGEDPLAHVAGGHSYDGAELAPLDEAAVRVAAQAHKRHVAAFAVVGQFGVLNPEHEQRAAAILREEAGLPVTCSHELTSRLNAPRRAVTCILNGRLIPLIDQLICAVQEILEKRGIRAVLMVVQADGSLVNAAVARIRPVHTILSGPAASVIGAGYLADRTDGLIADIGGTTTDLALLKDGQPKLNVEGAVVGTWRTMVEAVDVRTIGLGGDSDISCDPAGQLIVGPQRAVPLSLLASQFPEVVAVLRAQLEAERFENTFGRFAVRIRALDTDPRHLGKFELLAWNAVTDRPVPLASLFEDHSRRLPFEALCRRGLLGVAAFTPSDASHVLGTYSHWNREAADLGARLWIRRRSPDPKGARQTEQEFAREVIERVTLGAGEAIAGFLFASDHAGESLLPNSRDLRLVQDALRPHASGDLRVKLSVGLPIIAVGGPAATFFPEVGSRLGTHTVIPEHAAVCNALGAVVSGVVQRVEARIMSPVPGLFRVHLPDGTEDFTDLESAAVYAAQEASAIATERAIEAGASDVRVATARTDRAGMGPNGIEIFVESSVRASASGLPLPKP